MFLRFGCRNFRSIADYQEISLVASSLKDTGPDLFAAGSPDYQALPLAAIYGANASGKTNLLKALAEMKYVVKQSHTTFEADGETYREPFRLDKSIQNEPTEFDIDFVVDDTRYHYGFCYDDKNILDEWLYYYNGNYKRTLFERKNQSFSFGKFLKGQNKTISELTRKNSLFLSASNQNNHKQLSRVFEFFNNTVFRFDFSDATIAEEFEKKPQHQKKVLEFLKAADTGICSTNIDHVSPPDDAAEFIDSLENLFRKHMPSAAPDIKIEPKQAVLKLGHQNEDGTVSLFNMNEESKGTKRMLHLTMAVLEVLDKGSVLFIDEIESSLHTLLSSRILELFSHKKTNPNGAQVIFTTHDTNILNFDFIRRDQIWFTEKDKKGATHLFPLTSIRTRNSDNLEKGYLQGRFGAVPFHGNLHSLMAK